MSDGKVAEIVITVNFDDGEKAVFTMSPNGQLTPSNADGVATSAENWYKASLQIMSLTRNLKLPGPGVPAHHGDKHGPVAICYPWSYRLALGLDNSDLVRVQYRIYPSLEVALSAGWPSAEFGTWQSSPHSTQLVEGWIALDYLRTESSEKQPDEVVNYPE